MASLVEECCILYIAICLACKNYLLLSLTSRAGLRPIKFGGRGDFFAIYIVGVKESLLKTTRGNLFILTKINCFSRYAGAVSLQDHTLNSIIYAVLIYSICIYNTSRRILTDSERAFDSKSFHKFCN